MLPPVKFHIIFVTERLAAFIFIHVIKLLANLTLCPLASTNEVLYIPTWFILLCQIIHMIHLFHFNKNILVIFVMFTLSYFHFLF